MVSVGCPDFCIQGGVADIKTLYQTFHQTFVFVRVTTFYLSVSFELHNYGRGAGSKLGVVSRASLLF